MDAERDIVHEMAGLERKVRDLEVNVGECLVLQHAAERERDEARAEADKWKRWHDKLFDVAATIQGKLSTARADERELIAAALESRADIHYMWAVAAATVRNDGIERDMPPVHEETT